MPSTENHWLFLSSDTGNLLQDGCYRGIPSNWTLYALKVQVLSAKKAKNILGYIRKDLIWRLNEVILPFYSAMVSHLRWCVQCWVPWYREAVTGLTRVNPPKEQEDGNRTREHPSNKERVRAGAFSLKKKRLKPNLIHVCKYLSGEHKKKQKKKVEPDYF